jgi:hypothetical protein
MGCSSDVSPSVFHDSAQLAVQGLKDKYLYIFVQQKVIRRVVKVFLALCSLFPTIYAVFVL